MTKNLQGDVFLIPLPIGTQSAKHFHTPYYLELMPQIRFWISENARTLRRYLASLGLDIDINELHIFESNHRTAKGELDLFLSKLPDQDSLGVVSEAGIPCIADPGNRVVKWAHRKCKAVHALIGPNSIVMALQGSGLNGQAFIFHGYPPIQEAELKLWLKNLFFGPFRQYAHAFIETPYRSDKTFQILLKNLPDSIILSVSASLHEPEQRVESKTIGEWKKSDVTWGKVPAVWVLGQE
jgi:16S rRNA (cytidine1402-2'-O)-methyltransferase